MAAIGAVKRKSADLDSRPFERDVADDEILEAGLEDEAADSIPWDPDVPIEPVKKSRLMGELDQAVPASSSEATGMEEAFGEDAAVEEGAPVVGRRFKTQLCKFFPLGKCQKGPNCSFAHGEHELMEPGGGQMASGQMFEEQNPEQKVLRCFKTQLCKFWESGQCQKGEACSFAHGEHELMPGGGGGGGKGGGGKGSHQGPRAYSPMMAWPALEMATMHEQQVPRAFKTVLCTFWPLGQCKKGDACTYAHGEEELQPAPARPKGAPKGCDKGKGKGKGFGKGKPMAMPALGWEDPYGAYVDPGFDMGYKGGGKAGGPVARGPPAGPPKDPGSKYKTVPCKFWPMGKCTKGEACTFLHDEAPANGFGGGCKGGKAKGGGWGKGGGKSGVKGWGDDGWCKGGGCWDKGGGGWGGGNEWGMGGGAWGKGGEWGGGGGWGKGGDWSKGGKCGKGSGKTAGGGSALASKVVPGFMVRQMNGEEAEGVPLEQADADAEVAE